MRSKIITSCILSFFILLLSCKKDKGHEPVTAQQPEPVIPAPATVTPTPFIIDSITNRADLTKFNPAKSVTSQGYGGQYSMDIDGDGTKDINLHVTCYRVLGGGILAESEVKIETMNEETYVLIDSICEERLYDCPNAMTTIKTVDALYPKIMSYHDTLMSDGNWRKGSFSFCSYKQDQDTLSCHRYWYTGYWLDCGTKYVAIKCKGKLGWLKIAMDYTNFALYEAAIENKDQ